VDPASGWNYYGCVILDEVSIYNRVLTAREIAAIYKAGSRGKSIDGIDSTPMK